MIAVKKSTLFSLAWAIGYLFAYPQTFNCEDRLYFFQSDIANSDNRLLSYISNYTTIPTITQVCTIQGLANALGANPKDMYLYYRSSASELTRLEENCNTTVVCNNLESSVSGCFDHKGRYWTTNSAGFVAIDISTCNIVKGPFTGVAGMLDVVYNEYDCYFYTSKTDNSIQKVDTNGNIVQTIPVPAFPYIALGYAPYPKSYPYGGIVVGKDGNLYGLSDTDVPDEGLLARYDLQSGIATTLISMMYPGPKYKNVDLAAFPCNAVDVSINVDLTTGCDTHTVNFSAVGSGPIDRWHWDFGNGDTSSLPNPIYTFTDTGNFKVTLTGENSGFTGCNSFASASIDISVNDCDSTNDNTYTYSKDSFSVYIPNAFAPDGLNKIFEPVVNKASYMEMYIFDRYSKLIFQSSAGNYGWDGTYRSKMVPGGVYSYYVRILFDNIEFIYSKRGNLTLIR